MTVSKERKAELTAQFGNSPVDTGNPKVQVAILSERIKELTEHMKSHQKDFHTRRGLLMLVGRRRRLLSYIKKNDIVEYRELIKALGIRDNIQLSRKRQRAVAGKPNNDPPLSSPHVEPAARILPSRRWTINSSS